MPIFTPRQENAIVDALARRFTPGDPLYVSILEALQATHAPAGPVARTPALNGWLIQARAALAELEDAAEATSNDAEIAAGQEVAALLSEGIEILGRLSNLPDARKNRKDDVAPPG